MKTTKKFIHKVLVPIFMIACLCISMMGCAVNQAAIDPTNESAAEESTGNITEAQIPDETDVATEPATEDPTPTETESTATETIHTHSYASKITNPTCTEGGYTTFTCGCSDTYTADQTDATGHAYQEKVTAPSCTEKGYTTYTCSCGDSYVSDYVSAKGHSYTKNKSIHC